MNTPNIEKHPLENSEGRTFSVQPTAYTDYPQQKSLMGLRTRLSALILLVVYVLGLGSGYLMWGRSPVNPPQTSGEGNAAADSNLSPTPEASLPVNQNPLPADYTLPVSFGDIGPQLLAAGAIDYDRFVQVYEQAGQPLTADQLAILSEGSDEPVSFNRHSAYFLLNFFWALGLTNQNVLLEEGPLMQYSEGEIDRFASTGGWTIGLKPVTALYASTPIIPLTPEQQARLEEVASAVYRPCCNNPTAFPDCNHGMAMLGMLELLAAQDATTDEMFTAAKYANAFWFPQQALEMAIFFQHSKEQPFAKIDAREFVSPYIASGDGFQAVHQWLLKNNLLEAAPNSGNSCGV